MALYNGLTGEDVRRQATVLANEIEKTMARIKYFGDSMAQYDAATMTALGIDEDTQVQIGSMRSDLAALETWYRANCLFVKRFAQLMVF